MVSHWQVENLPPGPNDKPEQEVLITACGQLADEDRITVNAAASDEA